MAEKTQFELVSPERLLASEAVEMAVIPGAEGDFGALPQHAPFMTALRPGVIDLYQDGKVVNRIFVGGGFAEVNETSVTVLAEDAVPLADVTADAVAARLRKAELDLEEADGEAARKLAQRAIDAAKALQAAAAHKGAAH